MIEFQRKPALSDTSAHPPLPSLKITLCLLSSGQTPHGDRQSH